MSRVFGSSVIDKQAFGAARFNDVRYEEFCDDVHGTLAGMNRFFEQRNVKVCIRGAVPPRFTVPIRSKGDAADYDRIAEKVRQLWG